ncbi:uncharacterized protein LOC142625217 [Castanea sativa]|uniref:uncharacterized protein LOC142625217 n=1 Tax=Castanea sativa TaxID=21020 RepID=UPI003F64EF58
MPRSDEPDIVFSKRDGRGIRQPHDDPLVIMLRVEEFNIHRILINNGSSADIIYLPAFQQMKMDKKRIRPFTSSLVSFIGDRIVLRGIITLTVIAGAYLAQVTKEIDFLIVDCPSTYNINLGRPTFNRLRAATATYYLKVKFSIAHRHHLNVNPECKPVQQKRRIFAPERNRAATEEVEKLLEAGFIREVFYLDWLANVILMDEEDQEKTLFVTSQGLYCYRVMPFGLKNAGATYQRLVNCMVSHQIGRNVEVYVDDMLVKSKDEANHLDDLKETFSILCEYNMKLNHAMCVFTVSLRKFLGFMVSQRGIEENPDKVKAIIELKSPKTVKEVQSLTGKVAALNRFVSRLDCNSLQTNNEAKYEALLTRLSLAKALRAKNLIVQVDSQLIIGQAKGDYEVKEERMQKYLKIVQQLSQHFDSLNFVQIPRAKNIESDFLARLA